MIAPSPLPLGPSRWHSHAVFYNGLTFAVQGDPTERDIASRFDVDKVMPKCQGLWRRHVCPATTRPHGINFRPGVSPIVCLIGQRSHSVLAYMAHALNSLSQVQAGDLGFHNRNCLDTILYAGNALQVMTELQVAVCGKPEPLRGTKDLSQQLGVYIDPFPDWQTCWHADRESASNYRNYLTHQGLFYTVRNQSGDILVLGRDYFNRAKPFTWTDAQASYASHPDHWQNVKHACREIVDDTAAFLDLSYDRLVTHLDRHLTNPAYQALWGWRNHIDPLAPLPVTTSPTSVTTGTSLTAASSSGAHVSSGPCEF